MSYAPAPQSLNYSLLRRKLGLTQQEVADSARTTAATVSHVEHGLRVPSDDMRRRLDAALALGDQEDADAPLYVLAVVEPTGNWTPLGDDEDRLVAFRNLYLADATVGLLRHMFPQLAVSPVWPSFLDTRRERGFYDAPTIIDAGSEAEKVERIAAWVMAFAKRIQALSTSAPGPVSVPHQTTSEVPA